MINIDDTRKALNFDLINRQLKQHYTTKNYKHAWRDIKEFLEKQGFTHRQYSGYLSQTNLSMMRAIKIINDLNDTFPWVKKCIRKFDITVVANEFDLLFIFEK